MTAVKTTTKELGDSRVRVEVEVGPETLERELAGAAGEIGREMKVPGFRQGKVPSQVVLQQVGREAVLDEAVRRGMPTWYEEAVQGAGLSTVGDPAVELESLPAKGAPLAFSFEIGVLPTATLKDYKGVEVGRRDPAVSEDEIQAELERLRESLASLETVDREAATGDFAIIDFEGQVDGEAFEGGQARGFAYELGSGRLIPGFDEGLVGARAGESREVVATFPDDYPGEHLAGKQALFAVSVKEVKEKRLPELDDDFAVEAGGFDSLEELRKDIEDRLRQAQEAEVENEFREAAVDAVAALASIEVPHDLVHSKAHEMWRITARRFQSQGLDPAAYLQVMGKSEEELIVEAEPDAERALRRESVLTAVIEAEGIEVSEDETLEALREASAQPGSPGVSEKALLRSLKKARDRGTDEPLKQDIAMRKAVDLIVEHAKSIPAEQAQAREEIWTPEKEKAGASPELWTPGAD